MPQEEIHETLPDVKIVEALLESFEHPAVVLWRVIELQAVAGDAREIVPGRILDLCCGEGRVARVIFGEGVIDTGLDINITALQQAQREGTYVHVIAGDAQQLPFASDTFDAVFSNSSVEHVLRVTDLLHEVARVLRPQGRFVFTVPNHRLADYFFYGALLRRVGAGRTANWYVRTRNRLLNHFHCYSIGHWESLLAQHGLRVIAHRSYLPARAIAAWDLLASLGVAWRIIHLPGPSRWPQWMQQAERRLIRALVEALAAGDVQAGAGYVIVAQSC